MTTREAAERLRRFPIPENCWEAGNSTMDDALTLAAAYLAEHPADSDEEITPEWLESVGFETSIVEKMTGNGFERIMVWQADFIGEPYLCIDEQGEADFECERIPKAIKTRSDVRRLCAALGIPLTTEDGK